MTRQERNKITEYIEEHGYSEVPLLKHTKSYYSKKDLINPAKPVETYMKISFYGYQNKHQCEVEFKAFQLNKSGFFNKVAVQREIKSLSEFVEFEEVAEDAAEFFIKNLLKEC